MTEGSAPVADGYACTLPDAELGSVTVFRPRPFEGPERPSPLVPASVERRPLEEVGDGPVFARTAAGLEARVRFAPGTSFYGTGEVAGPLERSGRTVTLWNTDCAPYDEHTTLYQSHPWVLALLPDGRARGLLADTGRRGTIAIDPGEVCFAFEEPGFELWQLDGAHPADVLRSLALLLGKPGLPPLWTLGYHQCRWSYESADELRTVAAEFRRRGIPCDALWLDIDAMDRFRVFTNHPERYPDLGGLTAELREQGFRSVSIVDPGVAVDSDLGTEGKAAGVFVNDASGEPVRGKVWPGECWFPDFVAPGAREWWSKHVGAFLERSGLDGLWTDMNEPSVFDVPTRTLPEDCQHAPEAARAVEGTAHAVWHNRYGHGMVAATHAGLRAARPDRRPFVLTRAGHIGTAHLAAMWTGDNRSNWRDLGWSIPMVLNLGLSGQPFAGPDAGGFFDDPDVELFARWFALAAFLPFFRGHAEKNTRRKEPWSLGAKTERRVRMAIERRMRLLPTLYTLFREASESGLPIARPLWFLDPVDPALRTIDDAFLLGDALLVAPIVQAGGHERPVRLPGPAGSWTSFPEGVEPVGAVETVARSPLGTIPLYARSGTVLIETEPRAHTAVPTRLLVVHAFLDGDGRATGRLYEDAGDGYGHERGEYRDTHFEFQASAGGIDVVERWEGEFLPPTDRRLFLVRHAGRLVSAPRARAEHHHLPA
jgi:alpha-glucosidase